MKDKYTYRVIWSEDDGEYVGLCSEFPSLSWLAKTSKDALKGIRKIVENDKKIRLASQAKCNKYKREVDEILNALDDIEEGWASSLITDESSFADYNLTENEIALLSFKLQENVKETDLIVDIAKKMHDTNRKLKDYIGLI